MTLSSASTGTITVTATTVSGSAVAGSDFTAKTQVLTFSPGTTTVNFTVSILPDSIAEPTETFTVVLSAPVGATIANGTGTVTVFDNDGAQMASAAPTASAPAVDRPLTQASARPRRRQAKAEWSAVLPGVDLSGITVTIADLPNLYLGFTMGKTITIDATAAGWGWSVMDPAGRPADGSPDRRPARAGPRDRADRGRRRPLRRDGADPGARQCRAVVPARDARAVALSPARASGPHAARPVERVRWLAGPSISIATEARARSAGQRCEAIQGPAAERSMVAPPPALALPTRVGSVLAPTASA